MSEVQLGALMRVLEQLVVAVSVTGYNAVPGARHMDLLRQYLEQFRAEMARGSD